MNVQKKPCLKITLQSCIHVKLNLSIIRAFFFQKAANDPSVLWWWSDNRCFTFAMQQIFLLWIAHNETYIRINFADRVATPASMNWNFTQPQLRLWDQRTRYFLTFSSPSYERPFAVKFDLHAVTSVFCKKFLVCSYQAWTYFKGSELLADNSHATFSVWRACYMPNFPLSAWVYQTLFSKRPVFWGIGNGTIQVTS